MDVTKRLRGLLVPFSWCYGAAITLRNIFYESGIFKINRIGTPVISVGNITTGGTGKTPLVEHLALRLIAMGLTPAFLSRGYGRSTRGTLVVSDGTAPAVTPDRSGDEPLQIARRFPGCAVVVDEKRARGARLIEKEFHPDVILLDDGFQHRALHRDLDIVILDDDRDAATMHMLPAGNRREPMSSLRRAGLLIVNRRGGTPQASPAGGRRETAGRIVMNHRLKRCVDPGTGREVPGETVRKSTCVAFCGIGSPESFRITLAENGISPAEFIIFPDHHTFDDDDLTRIATACGVNGAEYIVTTEKDAVRLGEGPGFIDGRLIVAEIETVIEEGDALLDAALAGVVRNAA